MEFSACRLRLNPRIALDGLHRDDVTQCDDVTQRGTGSQLGFRDLLTA